VYSDLGSVQTQHKGTSLGIEYGQGLSFCHIVYHSVTMSRVDDRIPPEVIEMSVIFSPEDARKDLRQRGGLDWLSRPFGFSSTRTIKSS
jgi:hypothetical protein